VGVFWRIISANFAVLAWEEGEKADALARAAQTFAMAKVKENFLFFSFRSVPTFVNLPEETLIKIADVLEEVRNKKMANFCLI